MNVLPPYTWFASVNKSTAVLADAVDPRAIGTDTMSAMHYRYQYNPDALAAPALLQSFHFCCSAGQPPCLT